MDLNEKSEQSDTSVNKEERSKRKVRKPKRFESDYESDIENKRKKKSKKPKGSSGKTVKTKSKNKKKKDEDGKCKGKKKGKGKPKKVGRSKVLVKKKRGSSDKVLDTMLASRLGFTNSFFKPSCVGAGSAGAVSAGIGQIPSAQPTSNVTPLVPPGMQQIPPRDIGANLLSAVRDRQKNYFAGTQIREVPKQYQAPPLERSPCSTFSTQRSPSQPERRQESAQKTAPSTNVGSANSGEVQQTCTQPIPVTYESVISRIPEHIQRSVNRGTQAMYALRLIYTREQIAQSSVTGTKSEYNSFVQNFGQELFDLYKRVLKEKFNIYPSEIATLISKRINYVRNSPKILRVAREKRENRKRQVIEDIDFTVQEDEDNEIQNEIEEEVGGEIQSSADDESSEEESSEEDEKSVDDSEDETSPSEASETESQSDETDEDEDENVKKGRRIAAFIK